MERYVPRQLSSSRLPRVSLPSRAEFPVRQVPGLPLAEGLHTKFGRSGPQEFTGYVVDAADPSRRFVVQLFIDGFPVAVTLADQYDNSLAAERPGQACYGFSFVLLPESLAGAACAEVRLANTGTLIGSAVSLHDPRAPSHEKPDLRAVRWVGGLRFTGWLESVDFIVPKVTAMIDGTPVTEAFARGWHQVGDRMDTARAIPAFDLHLPARFADGRVHSVRIVDEVSEDLPGSPLSFVAFEDGLERTLSVLGERDSERLRGQLFDRLVPASLPMSRYDDWSGRFPARPLTRDMSGAVAVVFAGEGDEEQSIGSLQDQTYGDWVAATLPPGEGQAALDPAHLERLLQDDAADCDIFILALAGLRLDSHAIEALAAALHDNPQAVTAYADLSVQGGSGEIWPMFFPAMDYERQLEQGYGAFLFAVPRSHLERALAARPASLFRLFNVLIGDPRTAKNSVVHVPGVLGILPEIDSENCAKALAAATSDHLRERGIKAEVESRTGALFPAVHVRRKADHVTVSVIIPTRNQVGLLRRCLETIGPAISRSSAEIIVVDNDSVDQETLDYLESIDRVAANVVRVPGAFNFARLNNVAANAAKGSHLCLLNNDIEAMDEFWLEEMLSRIVEPDVGAVGATLSWPSGVIQHAGVVLGPNLGAIHAFTDRMQGDGGYADMLSVARECSAVTAACLLTRKDDYRAVGGMDETYFPVNFNDVDYCLKLRAMGRRIVVTPHARLLHLESASRGSDQRTDRAGRFNRELRTLRARWLEAIVDDPCYNPMLSLDSIPFSALAWPPRANPPRFNASPKAVAVPQGM